MLRKVIATVLVISALFCSFGTSVFASDVVLGDVDGDGNITSTDFLRIKKFLLNSEEVTEEFKIAADVNEDGIINSTDYLCIKQLWMKASDQVEKSENANLENNTESEPVESEPAESEPVESEPAESEPVESEPVESEPAESEPVESEPVESEPVESEDSEEAENDTFGLLVYVPDFEKSVFNTYKSYFDGTAEGIFQQLASFGVLPEDVEVLSFEIEGSVAKIDLSEEFGKAITNARAAEGLIISAVANTIVEYFNVKAVSFTVEGEVLETGLAVYDAPISFQTPIDLYIPNDDYTDFVKDERFFDGTIQGLVDALAFSGAVPQNVKVYSFSIKGKKAIIDLSKEFGVGVNEARASEFLIVNSLVNTIIKHYNLKEVEFTVEGEILETGLTIYDCPIPFKTLISLYVPNEEKNDFDVVDVYFDGTIQGLVDVLSGVSAIPADVKVYSFNVFGNVAKIDLSKEFGVGVNEARASEFLVVGSLANTIIKYYNVEKIEFTVEGKTLETGLTVYDYQIPFQKLITLYVPNESRSGFDTFDTYFDGTIDGLVNALVTYGAIPKGTKVYSFTENGETAKFNLSDEFGVGVNEARTGESLVVGSLVNTVIRYYKVDYVHFIVEGKILETGLNIYDSPIEFMA